MQPRSIHAVAVVAVVAAVIIGNANNDGVIVQLKLEVTSYQAARKPNQ